MKKTICTKCNYVIDVDENNIDSSKVFKCPKCNELINLNDCDKKVYEELKYQANNAYKYLYIYKDYKSALDAYEKFLLFKPNDFSSVLGLLMCELKLSTLDNPKFSNIIKKIDSIDVSLNGENSYALLSFINDSIYDIDNYFISVKERLMINEIFISKKYFDIYYKTLKEIKDVIKYYKNALTLCDEEEINMFKSQNKFFESNIKKISEGIDKRLNSEYKINDYGIIKISNDNLETIKKEKYNLEVLGNIELSLYPNNKKSFGIKKIITIISLSCLFLSLILFVVFFITKLKILAYLGFVPIALLIIFILIIRKTLNTK